MRDLIDVLIILVVAFCSIQVWERIIDPWLDRREERKRKELVSILIDPTSKGNVLEIRNKKGQLRYYKNCWRISKKAYDEEITAVVERMHAKSDAFPEK